MLIIIGHCYLLGASHETPTIILKVCNLYSSKGSGPDEGEKNSMNFKII